VDGPEISGEEHEIVLSEEEIVVDKRVVPKERIRVDTDVEVEEREVTEQVRKEQVELDGDTTT
jgi:stress response protein YsnF